MKVYLAATSILACMSSGIVSAQRLAQSRGLPQGHPITFGVLAGGGTAIADHVSNGFARAEATLNFTNIGVRLGKVVDQPHGNGFLSSQLEIASGFTPFWQAIYPKQKLVFKGPNGIGTDSVFGYTTRGIALTPIQLRLDFLPSANFVPWTQIACSVLWTTRDFPVLKTASINFMPQAGFGVHYFHRPHQSIDFAINAIHISNGDTADRNPGVNVTVQASIGYSWWSHKY